MAQGKLVNGVDVGKLKEVAGKLRENPELAKFHFRAENRWLSAGHSRTTITDFHAFREDIAHDQAFVLDADEPHVLLSGDEGPNPVEHLLNALVTCLTGSLVYHAAIRDIELEQVESTVEGDIDVRGFMGLSDEVRRGYQNIQVTFRVRSDAPEEQLQECARFSPVFDTVTNGTSVDLQFERR